MIKTLKQAVRQEKEPLLHPQECPAADTGQAYLAGWYLPCGEEVHHDVGETAAHPP